ncbi:MAG: ABC transporter ATP-binding protein [Deltaproteobacteria bacterium]|nr:ABC transporter ATP-binding protein [Deltaproteobacteria bacterium]
MSDAPLIELSAVTKAFVADEVETLALAQVHLDVRRGEWVSIVGPSGSGKTTLLAILGLLEKPTSGVARLDGIDTMTLSEAQRAELRNTRIGFIFQSFNLIGDLTVQENVELPLTFRGLPASERKKRALEALERVGMAGRARHLPGSLSGGQQQRTAVARAVAGNPPLLLADEPTGNLDSKSGLQVMQLLGELHQGGATVCMVTHDPGYARRAQRQVVLFDGRIVDETLS